MVIFGMILVFIAVLFIGFNLYKLVKEEKAVFEEERKKAKEEEEKRKENSVTKILNEKPFEELLQEAACDENKLENLILSVKHELREAMRKKDTEKIKECNIKLRKLDSVEANLKGNQ